MQIVVETPNLTCQSQEKFVKVIQWLLDHGKIAYNKHNKLHWAQLNSTNKCNYFRGDKD